MRRRMGRPGLMGTMARTAVIAGTATAVSGGMRRGAAQRSAQQEQASMQQPVDQAAAQGAAAPPAADGGDRIAKLKDLGELKAAGVLSEAEFAAEKARILAT